MSARTDTPTPACVTVRFTVDGEPLPKQRPRHSKNGAVYTPKKTKDYERLVGDYASVAMFGRDLMQGDLVVRITFYRKNNKRADIDNLAKAVLDGMNKKVYRDDKQIIEKHTRIVYAAAEPRAEIEVRQAVNA